MLDKNERHVAPSATSCDTRLTLQEILRRLVRMETRMVNMMAAHNLTRDGHARQKGTV